MRWVACVRSGALDGDAGAGEAAGAAVVGEAPLLHQPDHHQRPTSARARRRGGTGAGREDRSARRVEGRRRVVVSACVV